jgi:protein-disulfide isomerase
LTHVFGAQKRAAIKKKAAVTNAKRETKNDRRAHAREEARLMREKQKKTERRRRFFIQGGIGVAVIAIAVIVTLVVVQNNANNVVAAAQAGGPTNMLSDGILFHGVSGKATVVKTAAIKKGGKPVATDESKLTKTANIVEYIDLQCPYCEQFLTANLADEEKWVAAGKATLEIHPISFLDSSSLGNRYSSRAANAVACVAAYEPNSMFAVLKTMYKDQPAENTAGASNSRILSMLSAAGVSTKKVTGCVNGESYSSWVTAATARANVNVFGGSSTSNKISTPTVFVNGQQYSATDLTSTSEFKAFVNSVKPGTAS